MNPQQPNGAFPPPPQGNPYDFITGAPPKPPRTSRVSLNGGSTFGKLALIIGGAVGIIIVVFVVVNLVFGSKTNFGPLISLTQTQQEIARTAAFGRQGIGDQSVVGAAINTRLSILTQQQNTIAYLSSHKQKISQKDLDKKKNATTDKQFDQAKATSTFDIVFTQTLRQELTDYAAELKTAYKSAPGNEARKLLATDYEQTQMLLKQWPEQ